MHTSFPVGRANPTGIPDFDGSGSCCGGETAAAAAVGRSDCRSVVSAVGDETKERRARHSRREDRSKY